MVKTVKFLPTSTKWMNQTGRPHLSNCPKPQVGLTPLMNAILTVTRNHMINWPPLYWPAPSFPRTSAQRFCVIPLTLGWKHVGKASVRDIYVIMTVITVHVYQAHLVPTADPSVAQRLRHTGVSKGRLTVVCRELACKPWARQQLEPPRTATAASLRPPGQHRSPARGSRAEF